MSGDVLFAVLTVGLEYGHSRFCSCNLEHDWPAMASVVVDLLALGGGEVTVEQDCL